MSSPEVNELIISWLSKKPLGDNVRLRSYLRSKGIEISLEEVALRRREIETGVRAAKKTAEGEREKLLSRIRKGNFPFPVVTTPSLPGYEVVKVIGPVYGLTVRSRGFGGRLVAGLETLVGGEITTYVSECMKARDESLMRLIKNAEAMGANAILRVDFETSDILNGVATIFSAYGTAVVVKPSTKTNPTQNFKRS